MDRKADLDLDRAKILPDGAKAVTILAFPEVQLLDVAGPLQVFSAANERMIAMGREAHYVTTIVGPEAALRSTAGLVFEAAPLPARQAGIDTLIVAGGRGVLHAATQPELVAWLAQRADCTRRIASVCTGAFLLAAAGLLDARRAVTHWEYCAELARRYPSVLVESDPIFVRDGPISTSAGVTAGIDLALALVEEDLGPQIALAVARQLVVFLKRPGDQAQFSAALLLQSSGDRFAELHDWMVRNLDEKLTVQRLAQQAGMGDRTFMRHYALETGLTPARAVERLRTEAARQLLTGTSLPIKAVATRCGFGSEEAMRRAFRRLLSVTPQDYRQRFGP